MASNGLIVDGANLWLADLAGQQLIKFDPDTGRILRRVGPMEGIVSPDDGVVLSDGSLVYTSPVGRLVGRVWPDGTTTVVARFAFGPNPIVRDPADPDGAVIIGDTSASGELVRVFLDGSAPAVIADDVPAINSFDVGPDGRVWAPAGGPLSGFDSSGGVTRLDLATGAETPVALSFPTEPARTGFAYPVAAKFGPDGSLYVLQGFDAAVFRIDPATGATERVVNIPGNVGDNLAFLGARLFASQFFGQVVEVQPGGVTRTVPIGG